MEHIPRMVENLKIKKIATKDEQLSIIEQPDDRAMINALIDFLYRKNYSSYKVFS